MSFATATCWGFNCILALTWPALVEAFTSNADNEACEVLCGYDTMVHEKVCV
ncbi:hypothetical protein BU16DRAFT_522459 [Lophium mytilinum]|uniref:Extracellular membrane protein CFEM domain-containing protein n=1 Tax=Lophium mytilinum TaxID=390894 RepID=A0A6A6RCM1_9PEZI|nr:hypothetical protein BU16DRAFT_522459 [Lophium mytilinum]